MGEEEEENSDSDDKEGGDASDDEEEEEEINEDVDEAMAQKEFGMSQRLLTSDLVPPPVSGSGKKTLRPPLQVGQRVRIKNAGCLEDDFPELVVSSTKGITLRDIHGVIRSTSGRMHYNIQWFGEDALKKLYHVPSTRIYACHPTEWAQENETRFAQILL